jgi:predicted dienelactone hydrolase
MLKFRVRSLITQLPAVAVTALAIGIGLHFFSAPAVVTASAAPILPGQLAYSIATSDAPELAQLGTYTVGVRTLTLTNPDQTDIPKMVKTLGISTKSDRNLNVEIWYPAVAGANSGEKTIYKGSFSRGKDPIKKIEFNYPGIAIRDATPLALANGDARFPLVIVSHGFGGWGTFMSYLTENLASKGYVVAAIDHADASFTDGGSFALSFGSTIVHRSRDQQFVLSHLSAMAKADSDALGRLIDAQTVGVIGYSMGGFGALATAGAGYDAASPTFKQIPAAVMAPVMEGNPQFMEAAAVRAKSIKALVLIAPWGAQPANRAWTAKSLKSVQAPTMLVVGDQDDIVEYEQGVKHLLQTMTTPSRHMLVYQNARHNTGGNPPSLEATNEFSSREYFDEPVWRKERLNAINQHFITAFLDLNLKGIAARAAYLDTPTVKANDAKWPVSFGQSPGGTYAAGTAETAQYWRGFQRRWAVGLEMHRMKAGE